MNLLKSLHLRLVGTYIALALLLLGATGLVFSRAFTAYAAEVHRQRSWEMMVQAQRVGKEARGTPDETAQMLRDAFPELEFAVVTPSSRPVALTLSSRSPDLWQPVTAIGTPTGSSFPVPVPSLLMTVQQIDAPGIGMSFTSPAMGGKAITVTPRNGAPPVLSTLYREVGITLVMALALAGLIGWRFSRWLARPVARLSAATAAVAGGDFLQQVAPTGTLELDRLAEQFNRMVARLDESFRYLAAERDLARRFAADAAHELKTPLTALRAYYELADSSPDRTGQVMQPMGRQIDRLERIMAGLLQLARLSDGTGIELTTGDAGEAVSSLLPGFRAMAEEYGHSLIAQQADRPLPARLDPHLLEVALTNLVENACKFTPAGGEIRLSLTATEADVQIAVADNGPGISPEELPHLFERFHRGINTQEIPGSGLGLSIVEEAARRLGGTLSVESEAGAGACFTLRLPLLTTGQED